MARAEASLVVPFGYATLVFTALYDAVYDSVVSGMVPDWISAVGAAVILDGALVLALR